MSDEHADHAPDDRDATPEGNATAKVEGDVTQPMAEPGSMSGEDDYVAVNAGGISGEKHVPTADEEVGRGSGYDPDAERYPDEERGDTA